MFSREGFANVPEVASDLSDITKSFRGIAPGKTISGMRQIDIAPTLSQALGIPVPKNAKGHVIAEVLVR